MRVVSLVTSLVAACALAGCLAGGSFDGDPEVVATDTEEICCGAQCCFIDGACRSNGQLNPANQCQSCNPASSQILWTTTSCAQNGAFCDGPEQCVPGTGSCASAGEPVGLDDGVACTIDSCDEVNDVVVHAGDDSACDDGVFCTGTETCNGTTGCQTTPPAGLDDGVAYTTDACVEGSQSFTHTTNDGACTDGLFCNGVERCDVALDCQAGTAPVINDGVGCTDDSCDEVNNVVVNAPNNANCSDSLFCNGVEICDSTSDCQAGTAPVINDGVGCTDDSCDEVNNLVVNTPNNANCSDSLFCNGVETCDSTSDCQAGTAPVINDGVSCTDDSCDEVNDVVVHAANDSLCNDSLMCTADTCDVVNDCQNTAVPGCGPDAGVDASVPDAMIDDAMVDDAMVDDAMVTTDAVGLDGSGQDAGAGEAPGGCGCSSGQGGSTGGLLLVLLVGFALVGRRIRTVGVCMAVVAVGCSANPDANLVDGGIQAVASTHLTLECDKEYTQTVFYLSGARLVQTHWYAEIDVVGLDPMAIRNVNTLMCGYEQLGPALGECPADAECTGKVPPSNYSCQIYNHAELSPGKLRVFCGTRQEYTSAGMASNNNSTVSGFRWNLAHVRIEPLR